MRHQIKQQPVDFVKVSPPKESEKQAFVRVSGLLEFLTADMVKMHFENNFSQISSLEMERNSAIIVFCADEGEREQNE